jgi:plastocyanin
MSEDLQPGRLARRVVLRRALGAGMGGVIAAMGMRVSRADPGGSEVTIDNFSFAPAVLQVKVGTTVTWVNHDDIPHSILCPKLNVRSHPLDTDQSFSYTFATAGSYDYICGIHPHMHGQVVVSA